MRPMYWCEGHAGRVEEETKVKFRFTAGARLPGDREDCTEMVKPWCVCNGGTGTSESLERRADRAVLLTVRVRCRWVCAVR